MTISLIAGNELGTQDSSENILNRQDGTGKSSTGADEHITVNVSNGNVVIEHQDVYLPSMGEDFRLVRTYNSRDIHSDAFEFDGAQWTLSSSVSIRVVVPGHLIEVEYGDGSVYSFEYDRNQRLYVATEGSGAYETIEYAHPHGFHDPVYILTRADQTQLQFDHHGRLEASIDTNGVRMDYIYRYDRLVQIKDDQGHQINYEYHHGYLHRITDETNTVLVEYHYFAGLLTEVIDRAGHSTKYFYTPSGYLSRIELPSEQQVDGQTEHYQRRVISFDYALVPGAAGPVVSRIIDAEGGITSFEYDFVSFPDNRFNDPFREHPLDHGGSTRVVDSLGNARAFSNEAKYVQWRTEHGYYKYYNAWDHHQFAQTEMIRAMHAVEFSYLSNGYLSDTVDQQGYRTHYEYNANGDVTAVTNADGWAITHSDTPYYRDLRAQMGIVDAAGQGKLARHLNWHEINQLKEAYTSYYQYDDNGNLVYAEDNNGSITTFEYTEFNKLQSSTSAEGYALINGNTAADQAKRVALGFAADLADLSAQDKGDILTLFTTTMTYDEHQNLIQKTDPGGDMTRYEYDAYGNVSRQIVYLDSSDLNNPETQQITQYFYDAFGNNIETVDPEGVHTFNRYDHFGNLVEKIDGNGGVTSYRYDADNRLLSMTDPEGNTTSYTYDAVGNRISITDANGHTTIRIYDLNNRLVSVIETSATVDEPSHVSRYYYDIVGNQTKVIDAEGRVTTYQYNTRNELLEVTTPVVKNGQDNAVQYTTHYQYDGLGNRISVEDNNGALTEFVYNADGLLASRTDTYGQVTQFQYDQNNNQVVVVIGAQLPELRRQILKYVFDEENQLIVQTDAEGAESRYGYDAVGNRIAVVDALGYTTEYEYDHNNRVVREIKPAVADPATGEEQRYTIEYGYDNNGNAVSVRNENGATTHVYFDKNNRQALVEDANGVFTRFTYDAIGQRTSVEIGVDIARNSQGELVMAENAITGQSEYQLENLDHAQINSYVYDEFGNLIAETDGVGNALQYSNLALYQQLRESMGYERLVENLSAADRAALQEAYTQHFTYDRVGNQTSVTDHLDRTTTMTYDALNRAIKQVNAAGDSRTSRYDGNGNLVWSQDEAGRISTYQYDLLNRLTTATEAAGTAVETTTTRSYDTFGNLLTQTRAAGTDDARSVNYSYDLNNRMLSQTNEEGHTSHYEYDALGQRLRITDGRGNSTRYVYDALGRTVKMIDPLSFETRYEYDGVGNRIGIIDANGHHSRYEFDPGNRLISTTTLMDDGEDRVTTYQYNVLGQQIEVKTAAGTAAEAITRYSYDAQGNLREVIDAEGGIRTQAFDAVYNQITSTDQNGNTTTTTFDALNRVIKVVDALGGETSISYDAVGNRLSVTDANHNVQSFEYDDKNRLIVQRTEADGVETHYRYDRVNNRTSITYAANTAAASTETFEYYADDQLKAQIDGEGHRTSFVYDEANNRTIVTDPEGYQTLYAYDANNRVASITDPEGGLTRYVYDGNGNRIQVIDPEGHRQTTYYNAANQALYAIDGEGYLTYFEYDAAGNQIAKTLYAQPANVPQTDTELATQPVIIEQPGQDQHTRFEYDRLNRLSAQVDAEGYRREFGYDAVGNQILSRQYITLDGSVVEEQHTWFDALNRASQQLSAEGYLSRFHYDALGNLTARELFDTPVSVPADGQLPEPVSNDVIRLTEYAYDHNNRVILERNPAGTETRTVYDARGNRIEQIEAAGTADARVTAFSYDKANRLISQTMAAGTSIALTTRFDYYADGQIKTQYQAWGSADQIQTDYRYDRNNRLIEARKPFGDGEAVVERYEYDAAGNRIAWIEAYGTADQRSSFYRYDAKNQLIEERLPLQGSSLVTHHYEYDGAGNRIKAVLAVDSAEQRVQLWRYDRDNRLVVSIDGEQTETHYQYDGAGNRTAVIADATGTPRTVHYQYDLENRVIASTSAEGIRSEFSYDRLGNQTVSRTLVDADQNLWAQTHAYFDILGRQTHSVSAEGYLTENHYDLFGNLLSRTLYEERVSLPADGELPHPQSGDQGRETQYSYDSLNRQIREIRADGLIIETDYDLRGNRRFVYQGVQADGSALRTMEYRYNDANNLTLQIEALGSSEEVSTHFEVNAFGKTTARYDAWGTADQRETHYHYDHQDRLVRQTTVLADGHEIHTDSQYNAHGDLVKTIQAAGSDEQRTVSYRYDDNGRMIEQIDANQVKTRYQYDAVGNRNAITVNVGADNARTQHYRYDLDNRRVAMIDAMGVETRYQLNGLGDVVSETVNPDQLHDTPARTIQYQYDLDSRMIRQTSAEGYITEYAYDRLGNRTLTRQQVNAEHYAETRAYFDILGRQTYELSPEGLLTRNQYDVFGNVTTTTQYRVPVSVPAEGDPQALPGDEGISVHYEYDALDRQVREIRADGFITDTHYDLRGNRRFVLEGVDVLSGTALRTTEFRYNLADQLTDMISAQSTEQEITTHYELNDFGKAVARFDAYGSADQRETRYQYDGNDNVISEALVLGQNADGSEQLLITETRYNAFGEVSSRTAAAGNTDARTTQYHYDHDGRLTDEINGEGEITHYQYDAAGNQIAVTTAYQTDDARTTHQLFDRDNRKVASIDAEGIRTDYQYDGLSQLIQETRAAGTTLAQTTHYQYDLDGRLQQVISPLGFTTSYEYDRLGNQTRISRQADDPATLNSGEIRYAVTYQYFDILGRQTGTLSPLGYLTVNQYDDLGRMLSTTQYSTPVSAYGDELPKPVDGDIQRQTHYRYDARDQIVEETNALGVITRYQYDLRGNRTLVQEAVDAETGDSQRQTAYQYDLADRLTERVDGYGSHNAYRTRFVLNGHGDTIRQINAADSDEARITEYTYDLAGRVTEQRTWSDNSLTEADIRTHYVYDEAGNLITQTTGRWDASSEQLLESRQQHFQYDLNNRITDEINGAGDISHYVYDALGNRVQSSLGYGTTSQRDDYFEFDLEGRVVRAIDGEGSVSEYRYDALGNKIKTIQAAGVTGEERVTTYQYDLQNRLLAIIDPEGGKTEYKYDDLGNQIQETNANGGVQHNTFDILGRMVVSVSAGGIKTVHEYDTLGNLIVERQGQDDGQGSASTLFFGNHFAETRHEYDIRGNEIMTTDPQGFSTRISYNAFNEQVKVENGLYLGTDATLLALQQVNTSRFEYDAAGRLISMTDAAGSETRYTYNANGDRITETIAANGFANTEPRTTRYEYDQAGRQVRIVSAGGSITVHTYNAAGQKASTAILQSGEGDAQVWSTTRYTYNGLGKVETETDDYGVQTRYQYDAVGNLTDTWVAWGTDDQRHTAMEYDLNNHKTADIDGLGNRTLYTYDALGNQTSVTDAQGHTAYYYFNLRNELQLMVDGTGAVTRMDYDAAGNVIMTRQYATRVDLNSLDQNTRFSLTAVNALVVEDSNHDRVVSSMFDQNGNELTQVSADGQITEKHYDAANNLMTEIHWDSSRQHSRTMHYEYDLNNRLTRFTDVDGSVTEFSYDGAGNKVRQVITAAAASVDPHAVRITEYQYDLNNRQTGELFDPNGLHILQRYEYDLAGNKTAYIDGNGHRSTYQYDQNNRVSLETNALGDQTEYRYDRTGNQVYKRDPRGGIYTYEFDAANRLIREHSPEAEVTRYDASMGDWVVRTESRVVEHHFDALGHEVQTIDADGYKTTRWFDANGNQTGELNARNVYTGFEYNAFGNQTARHEYLQYLGAAAHNVDIQPQPGDTHKVTTRMSYDDNGRLLQTRYADIEHYTLNTASGQPSTTSSDTAITEQYHYDEWGNLAWQADRNGHKTWFYYDNKDRQVVQIDAMGYLTETVYDAQDNILEQYQYSAPVQTSSLTGGRLPEGGLFEGGANGGFSFVDDSNVQVYHLTRRYDAANRMISETTPAITTFTRAGGNLLTPVTTEFVYDQNGNQIAKTRAANIAGQSVTEYFYFDAANRMIAAVDEKHVLTEIRYDGNGNTVLQARYNGRVSSTDFLHESLTSLKAQVSAGSGHQVIEKSYDGFNQLTQEIQKIDGGSAISGAPFDSNDLVTQYGYDGLGHETVKSVLETQAIINFRNSQNNRLSGDRRFQVDNAYVTRNAYDGMGNLIRMQSPDGTGSIFQYDTRNNQTLAYTGEVSSYPEMASNIAVEVADTLNISWQGSPRAYVVSYSGSRAGAVDSDGNINWNALEGNGASKTGITGNQSASLALEAGETRYFRVVSVGIGGNKTVSEEYKVTMPAVYESVSIIQSGDHLAAQVHFNSSVEQPAIVIGGQSYSLVAIGDNDYRAELPAGLNAGQNYRIQWQSAGQNYSSDAIGLASPETHTVTHSSYDITLNSSTDGNTFNISYTPVLPQNLGDYSSLALVWQQILPEDSTDTAYVGSRVLSPEDIAAAQADPDNADVAVFPLALEDLPEGEYQVSLVITNAEGQQVLDRFTQTLAGTDFTTDPVLSIERNNLSLGLSGALEQTDYASV
ncbi:DUF6531 domain-containing protein, partial [Gynuella sp.]|uniref:DUF6531 domain-containing protein n=1 Tax=Gynuella sp. TaxID=2969146 RepID=UPI003D09E9F3